MIWSLLWFAMFWEVWAKNWGRGNWRRNTVQAIGKRTKQQICPHISAASTTNTMKAIALSLPSLLLSALSVLLLSFAGDVVFACSDILVTPGASEDGSAMIAYNADDVSLYGVLYHYPATQGKEGDMIDVYEWDTGVSALPKGDTRFLFPIMSNPSIRALPR